VLSPDSCSQNYTGGGAVVQFTKGERPFSIRQNADTPATTSVQGGGLAVYERDYLAGLLASLPVRSLADMISVRDGVATIRAAVPLHLLSLEDACTLQGLAAGGSMPVPSNVAPIPQRRAKPEVAAQPLPTLTDRQREILQLLCAGKSNREISTAFNLTEGTVKVHVSAILKALGALNRTHAVMIARRVLAVGEV
jgi:DNA-binding CsgD family transcriptional regulator